MNRPRTDRARRDDGRLLAIMLGAPALSGALALGGATSACGSIPTPANSGFRSTQLPPEERATAHEAAATRTGAAVSSAPGHVPTVEETNAAVGEVAPNFSLVDLDGKAVELASHRGKIVVLEWFSPTSPESVFAWSERGTLRELSARLRTQNVVWLAINSDDPQDSAGNPEVNRAFARAHRMEMPVLLDPTGRVGRAYGAKTTMHLFVVNEKGRLVYSGALDNAPGGEVEPSDFLINHVNRAVQDIRSGRYVVTRETTPYGTAIHYATKP